MSIGFDADFSAQNHSSALAKKQQQAKAETVKEESLAQQSQTTGLQWVAENAQNPAAATAAAQVAGKEVNLQTKGKTELAGATFEDVVVFSSVDTSEEVAPAVKLEGNRLGFNLAALEEVYRETFKKSKSHNYLLERFMSSVKFSGLKLLFSVLGVPASVQDQIQTEVRKQVLKEIDDKLRKEWAYTKAMLDMVG